MRNNKKTAILALMDETSKKGKNNKKPDSKSPPKPLKSDRALSYRAAQLSQREPEHEAFGLEPPPLPAELRSMMCPTAVRMLKEPLDERLP